MAIKVENPGIKDAFLTNQGDIDTSISLVRGLSNDLHKTNNHLDSS